MTEFDSSHETRYCRLDRCAPSAKSVEQAHFKDLRGHGSCRVTRLTFDDSLFDFLNFYLTEAFDLEECLACGSVYRLMSLGIYDDGALV